MRLIDADALAMHYTDWQLSSDEEERDVIEEAIRAIDNAPTIDAVPVVRCKDCKHNNERHALTDGGVWCEYWGTDPDNDDFCSYGERRTSDE